MFAVLHSVPFQQQYQRAPVTILPPTLGSPPMLGDGPGPSKRPRLTDGDPTTTSPYMPVPMPRWAEALRIIDSDRRRVIKHPGNIADIGFKYPKPEIFLNSKNRGLYTATWLAIRAHHAYTLGTGKTLPPPITNQQWRNFLLKIQLFLHPEGIRPAGDLEAASSVPEEEGRKRASGSVKPKQVSSRAKHAKKSNTYLDDIPLNDAQIDKVVFYDTTIQLGTVEELQQAFTPEVSQEILWELCHMSFRFELVSLDAIVANAMYHAREGLTQEKASAARIHDVLRVFLMAGDVVGSFMINEIPNRDLGLTAPELGERNRYLTALGHLMCAWRGCPDSIKNASYEPSATQVRRLEEACTRFYCQTFFDNFGRAPIIPCRLPSRSLARSQPASFADSISLTPPPPSS